MGSIEMLLIARFGELASRPSILVNVTALAGSATAFLETKRRLVVVEAQSVELSLFVRLIQPTAPPERLPRELVVSDKPSSATQSPHCAGGGGGYAPVNSLQ